MLTIRELYPVSEAHWRVPTLLLLSGSGMAIGGSLAGFLYDKFGYYAPAFGAGVAFNVANLSLLAILVLRQYMINKESGPLRRNTCHWGCYHRRRKRPA